MTTSPGQPIRPRWLTPIGLALIAVRPALAEEKSGEQIYKARASCHGTAGEGPRSSRGLSGDRSIAQLARLIEQTMPEDDPGTCVGEDARKVAAYLYDAFYSKTARARNKPARLNWPG